MSTGIQWTDETWNPVVGCTQVSPGCARCYAKELHDKRHKAKLAGKALPAQYAEPFETVQLMPSRLMEPLRWRKPRRVFVNSVADLFHDDVPDEFIAQVFAVMGCARRHTFQALTKRPARMLALMSSVEFRELVASFVTECALELTDPHDRRTDDLRATAPDVEQEDWPLPNVWLGVSVENQRWADERIPLLLKTPAAVRFLSCEPLLGPLDLTPWDGGEPSYAAPRIDWVIVGGESGPGARPMELGWAEWLRDQCWDNDVAFFLKQLGGHPNKRGHEQAVLDGVRYVEMPMGEVRA